jgi:predicted enzyme related to lactoylglutathione lyase
MAHRSKLSQIVIDGADLHAALAFWAGALGLPMATARIEDPYATLGDIGGLHIVVQRVPEPKTAKSRVHLDIETDDIEAEVQRLEALGARRMEQHEDWWVMQDPGGNEFCVFGPRLSADFPADARMWDEQASDHA